MNRTPAASFSELAPRALHFARSGSAAGSNANEGGSGENAGPLREWHLLHGDTRAAARARHDFVQYLRPLVDARSDVAGAEVIFGELVANAIEHGLGAVVAFLFTADHELSLIVIDEGCGASWPPPASPPPAESLRGRGLYFVSRLARDVRRSSRLGQPALEVVLPVELQTLL